MARGDNVWLFFVMEDAFLVQTRWLSGVLALSPAAPPVTPARHDAQAE